MHFISTIKNGFLFQNLIEGLDSSLNSVDFSTFMSQDEKTDEKGDTKIGRGSSDSVGTNNSVYCDAIEVSIAIFLYQI